MERDKGLLETIMIYFTRITTIVIICAAVFIMIYWGVDVELDCFILLQIPLIGLLTAVPCVLLFRKDNLSKKAFLLRNLLFYLYVNAIVFGLGFCFDWIRIENKVMLIGMFVDIMIVFVLVGVVTFCFDQQTSNRLNRRLEELNKD